MSARVGMRLDLPVCRDLQVLPSELFQAHTAVEYLLSQPVMAPPAFVFVVDVAGDAADLEVRDVRA